MSQRSQAAKPTATKLKRAKARKDRPEDDEPFPLELQASNLKVSAFCRRGAGYHKPKSGGPGGFIYEKAKSRHLRHREVYKSSRSGKRVAERAVPLGHSGKGGVSERSEAKSLRRKAVIDAARKEMMRNRRR